MNKNTLLIHCAATPNGNSSYDIYDIDIWHKDRGFKRTSCDNDLLKHVGYHIVINTRGVMQYGRTLDEKGAHCRGQNSNSIGLCLVGTDKFTVSQWRTLRTAIINITEEHGPMIIRGHRYFNAKKTCPGFDVDQWLLGGMAPLTNHIFKR